MRHESVSILLDKLRKELDDTTSDIDKDNKKKEYLTNNIKELTDKKNEIDKIVGDYEKEFNKLIEKNAEFQGYVESKKPMTDSLGDKKQDITRIINEQNEKVLPTKNELKKLLNEDLPNAKTGLLNAQSNLTIKQKDYEDFKTWLKDYPKELQNKSKELDGLKTSIDDYIKKIDDYIKKDELAELKDELAELYFFIKESNAFSENLQQNVEKPGKFKSDLEDKWKNINVEMRNVRNSEDSLRETQYKIEEKRKELIRLEAERLKKILEKIADLGACETAEHPVASETSES